MNSGLISAVILAFVSGFCCKTLMYRAGVYGSSALFVHKMASEVLKLIGAVVYKVSYVDQMYAIHMENISGKEDCKRIRNELRTDFEEWKLNIIQEFTTHYPTEYRWQLEFDDWKGAMKSLTDIYKEKKIRDGTER